MQDFEDLPETITIDSDRVWELDLVKKRENRVSYFVETRDRLLSFSYMPKGPETPLGFYLVTLIYDPGKSRRNQY